MNITKRYYFHFPLHFKDTIPCTDFIEFKMLTISQKMFKPIFPFLQRKRHLITILANGKLSLVLSIKELKTIFPHIVLY